MVHELVPTIFELAAPPPSYQDFFADSYGPASLFFILTCFHLQKLYVWLGNSTKGPPLKKLGPASV